MVGITGENLSVILCCSHSLHHNWMSFLSWYSFQRNLPNAKFIILCSRSGMKYDLFRWAKRAGISFETVRNVDPMQSLAYATKKNLASLPALVITPDIICIREFDNDFPLINKPNNFYRGDSLLISSDGISASYDERLWCDVKENNFCNFVSYSSGWGDFNLSQWIDKLGNPLQRRLKFASGTLGVNERRLADIWEGATGVFHSLSRS